MSVVIGRSPTLSCAIAAVVVAVACAGGTTAGTSASRTRSTEVGAFTLTNDRSPLTNRPSPTASTFDDKRNGMLGVSCLANGLAVLVRCQWRRREGGERAHNSLCV